MANASFTRDEVILALDTLYFSGEEHLTKNSPAITELCELLRELPIHPAEGRPDNFRNAVGVSDQIYKFNAERTGKTQYHYQVGILFSIVADEFENNKEELHQITECIKRNKAFLKTATVGSDNDILFQEGALVEYIHKYIEKRDRVLTQEERCDICQLSLKEIYKQTENLLEKHLTVLPTALDVNKKYNEYDFITVCPNCHAALHRYRPWLTKDNCEELLR